MLFFTSNNPNSTLDSCLPTGFRPAYEVLDSGLRYWIPADSSLRYWILACPLDSGLLTGFWPAYWIPAYLLDSEMKFKKKAFGSALFFREREALRVCEAGTRTESGKIAV